MKILMVGGNFDENGGRKSSLIDKMYGALVENLTIEDNITYVNGGTFNELEDIYESVVNYNTVLWFANVPNTYPKIRDVKKLNPYAIFIGSKRNIDNEYSFVEVLNRTLMQRHNLSIMFYKDSSEKEYNMMLFDPLGTSFYDGKDFNKLMKTLANRVRFLLTTTRRNTFKAEGEVSIKEDKEFLEYVREVAEIFHKTIQHSDGVTRFLGNSSYRGEGNLIYVSERDVDKSVINIDHFVAAFTENGKTYYYGDKKPSKDTIVQTYLYKMFPNINYIVHSHCYVDGGVSTKVSVPCGSLDEIDEIVEAMKEYNRDYTLNYYKFNLKGHGCLILGRTLEDMRKSSYITRNLPEKFVEE